MLYFATRMQCPMCRFTFTVWFQTETPPEADARYLVYCPENASDFVLPLSVFKQVKQRPTPGAEAERTARACNKVRLAKWLKILDLPESPPPRPNAPLEPPKLPWWQFWKR